MYKFFIHVISTFNPNFKGPGTHQHTGADGEDTDEYRAPKVVSDAGD